MDGILYSAIGDRFFAEALTSARSSLRFNHIPHLVCTDQDAPEPETESENLSIRTYRPTGDAFAEKIRNMAASPFERSIFLDTDTYVANHLRQLFALLDKFDMAAALAPGYRGGNDPEVPPAFFELNTGVIAWRAGERTASFFAEWLDIYEDLKTEPVNWLAEQPAFRRCAWRHDLAMYVLGPEYNYRLNKPGSAVAQVRVVHGRSIDYEEIVAILNRDVGPRVFPPFTTRPPAR